MRTKTLLSTAALLAAGVATPMAQSSNVYSLNVVGYVNVPVYGGGQYNMICNPLNNANNNITNLFSGSGAFINDEVGTYDALIVDEAHRLNAKSGLYRNLGENQIKELINACLSHFFACNFNAIIHHSTTYTIRNGHRRKNCARHLRLRSS